MASRVKTGIYVAAALVCAFASTGFAQNPTAAAATDASIAQAEMIPAGSKVYIAPMGGFETYLAAALTKKKVPLLVVAKEDQADFKIAGVSQSQRPGWARTIFFAQTGKDEEASITVTNEKTGVVAFAYEVHKENSFRGQQSAAEACAKHLKNKIEGKEQ